MRVSRTSAILSFWTYVLLFSDFITAENLTCYQCTRKTNTECNEQDLLPCPAIYDRCVTHISKDNGNFMIKRQCGLAPCDFNDAMVDRGLGLDKCDRSRQEYFCTFCCKGSGCNKNSASTMKSLKSLLIVVLVIVVLNIFKNYQPPYLPFNDEIAHN